MGEFALGLFAGLCTGVLVVLMFWQAADRRRLRGERREQYSTRTSMSGYTYTSTETSTSTTSTYEWLTREIPERVRKRIRVIRTKNREGGDT